MASTDWLSEPGPGRAGEFRIERPSGRPVTGAVWLPETTPSHSGLPMLLCGHGASGDRYQAPIPYLARRFTQDSGAAVLSIDGPVHGLRQVGPGGRAALSEEVRRPRFVDDMIDDWHLALETTERFLGRAGGRTAYFGLSMGSMFGIPLLASGIDVHVATIGLLGAGGAAAAMSDRLRRDASRLTLPLLFLVQLEDELFDRASCLALFDALASDDKRIHANPGMHPEIPGEEIDFAVEFMARRLGGDVPRRVVNPLAE